MLVARICLAKSEIGYSDVDDFLRVTIFICWSQNHYFGDFSKIMIPDVNNVGRVFPMVMVFILPRAEFGSNDYRKDAPH